LDLRVLHRRDKAEEEERQAQQRQRPLQEDNGSNRVMIAGRCSSFHKWISY
jgi:hypothetical protein